MILVVLGRKPSVFSGVMLISGGWLMDAKKRDVTNASYIAIFNKPCIANQIPARIVLATNNSRDEQVLIHHQNCLPGPTYHDEFRVTLDLTSQPSVFWGAVLLPLQCHKIRFVSIFLDLSSDHEEIPYKQQKSGSAPSDAEVDFLPIMDLLPGLASSNKYTRVCTTDLSIENNGCYA